MGQTSSQAAAESHVDRSILSANEFIRTNVLGTQVLLDSARAKGVRRFCQISTDEVMGSLPDDSDDLFTEQSPFQPIRPMRPPRPGPSTSCGQRVRPSDSIP